MLRNRRNRTSKAPPKKQAAVIKYSILAAISALLIVSVGWLIAPSRAKAIFDVVTALFEKPKNANTIIGNCNAIGDNNLLCNNTNLPGARPSLTIRNSTIDNFPIGIQNNGCVDTTLDHSKIQNGVVAGVQNNCKNSSE